MYIELQETDSTNLYLKRILSKENPAEGTVVYAHFQTGGLGQTGNSWESNRGENLTMSKVIYPGFLELENIFSLNQAVALAVCDMAREITRQEEITVKWPNDIYSGNKKLAGILISNEIELGRIKSSIIGVGVNINQSVFSPCLPNPVSFRMLTTREYDIKYCLNILNEKLEERYEQLKQGDCDQINIDYLNCLYLYQTPARFESDEDGVFEGTITGLDPDGRLMIQQGKGVKAYDFKEVRFL